MELGIQVVGAYDHVLAISKVCEETGIAAVALADHYLYGAEPADYGAPAYDSLVQAAALARDTERIELVMLVSPITFRHPAVYAKSLTTIDEIADGRFVFGLGTGWHDGEHEVFGFEYPDMATRFEWLEDALGYLRVYVDDPAVGYEGRFWSLEAGHDLGPRTRADLRILVGGGGAAKTPALVGRFGDEFNLYHHTAEGVAARLDVMRRAAEQAGRDPDTILVSTCLPTIGGADDAEIDEFLAEWGRDRGKTPAELRERFEGRIPIQTWDVWAERLAEFESWGIQRTYLQVIGSVTWAAENAARALA